VVSDPSLRLEQRVFHRYVLSHGLQAGIGPREAQDFARVWTALSGRTALDFKAGADLETSP